MSGRIEPYRDLHGNTQGGPDVRALQDSCNRRLRRRNLGKFACAEDSHFGPQTMAACIEALTVLGAQRATIDKAAKGTLTEGAQRIIRHPDAARSARNLEIARFRARELVTRAHAKALRDVQVSGNKVTGGTERQRVLAAAVRSEYLFMTGKTRRYYSQAGSWDVTHEITGPAPGHRDDCSLWFIGMYWSAGAPDPAKTGYEYGNTATLWTAGREIPVENARGADAIIYSTNGRADGSHHVEMKRAGEVTIGHGDAAVNAGTVHEMDGAHAFTFIDD